MSPDLRGEQPIFVVLAQGSFGLEASKTAASAVRYLPGRVAAVLDSEHAGETAADTLGFGDDVPVVAELAEALALDPRPEALLVGVAPQGGALPDAWRPLLRRAMDAGLDLWSGLHVRLAGDTEISRRAREAGVRLRDLREVPDDLPVATGRAAGTRAHRILTVGTDCNVGKMTTTLELRRELERRGVSCAFAATGQTGILVEGRGIAVDAVKSDFVAGAAERLVLEAAGEEGAPPAPDGGLARPADSPLDPDAAARDGGAAPNDGAAVGGGGPDAVLVEGQGSLLHPGYSGVTLGLIHGSMPQTMVLCWMPSRDTIYGGSYDWVELPPLDRVVEIHEEAASWVRPPEPCRVVAVSCCTYDLGEPRARRAVERAREVTGLPATDPVRFGPGPLADAVEEAVRG
jgi:uncharacterized NAD-dependent epimerase/dehydratase family protein